MPEPRECANPFAPFQHKYEMVHVGGTPRHRTQAPARRSENGFDDHHRDQRDGFAISLVKSAFNFTARNAPGAKAPPGNVTISFAAWTAGFR